MAGFNRVILMGNLTRDPELRFTSTGTAVARIGLAINRVWRTETGESKEEVTFVDVSAFGRQAETIGQYLKKGRPVLIEGRLRTESWEDKQTNQKKSRLSVVLESFKFVDGGSGRRAEGEPSPAARPQPASSAASAGAVEGMDDLPPEADDVPF